MPGSTEVSLAVQVRQFLPEAATSTVAELVRSLELEPAAPADRPYTIVNFVSSVDGRAAFHGRSGPFGDDADKAIFHGLRERVDAVLAGTNTLRTERYGRLIRDRERRRRRAASGLTPEPLACVVTRSGDVPTDIPLFSEPEARIVIFTGSEVTVSACAASVEVVRVDPGELTLTTAARRLRSDFDIRALLCEGGPTIFSALLQEDLVDELFLTLAPKLTGGGPGPSITSGPELKELRQLALIWALERDSSLYLRYGLH